MFFLKKVFQARQKVAESRSRWDDVEKPFLDHLDDLRTMLVKMVATLMVAMIGCFIFDKQLIEIIRYPVKLAGLESVDGNKLPEAIKEANWGKIKEMARAAGTLEPGAREAFLGSVPDGLRPQVEATIAFRAALALPTKNRLGFLDAALPPGESRELATFLIEKNPDAFIDQGGELLRMSSLGPAEAFMLSFKLAFYAGIILSFPLLVWYLAEFIVPGLTPQERRMLVPSVLIGFVLFVAGVCFAYFVVCPRALRFFYDYSIRLGVVSDWRIGYFVSFVTQFTFIFGLCFELPVVIMAIVKLGLLGYQTMSRTRSYAILAIFVVAAIITPTTDALTLFLLAAPMIGLYEICIWMAWGIERKERKKREAEDREWEERRLAPDPHPAPANEAALTPAAGALPMLDDERPADWGHESDPYDHDPYNPDPYDTDHYGPGPDDAEEDDAPTDDAPPEESGDAEATDSSALLDRDPDTVGTEAVETEEGTGESEPDPETKESDESEVAEESPAGKDDSERSDGDDTGKPPGAV